MFGVQSTGYACTKNSQYDIARDILKQVKELNRMTPSPFVHLCVQLGIEVDVTSLFCDANTFVGAQIAFSFFEQRQSNYTANKDTVNH